MDEFSAIFWSVDNDDDDDEDDDDDAGGEGGGGRQPLTTERFRLRDFSDFPFHVSRIASINFGSCLFIESKVPLNHGGGATLELYYRPGSNS